MPHSALCGSAASTVEQLNRHQVVFGKSGKHHANTLSVPVACRDADAEQKPTDTNKKINGNLGILVAPSGLRPSP
jgi:hypothetical protein